MYLVPDGSDHLPRPKSTSRPTAARAHLPLVMLLGNFAYAPNVDAALHLCAEILPRVSGEVPDVNVWLVGNQPPPEVLALQDDRISVTGRVDDAVPFLDAADVVVCPLRVGGGIKVKMIEALRRGKAIVSISGGIQGLPPEAREALVVADETVAFTNEVAALLRDSERRAAFERGAARRRTRGATTPRNRGHQLRRKMSPPRPGHYSAAKRSHRRV